MARFMGTIAKGRVITVGEGFATDGRDIFPWSGGGGEKCLDMYAPVGCFDGETCASARRCSSSRPGICSGNYPCLGALENGAEGWEPCWHPRLDPRRYCQSSSRSTAAN